MLKIEIATDNQAFEGDSKLDEVCRILIMARNRIADLDLTCLPHHGKLLDINGNVVGTISLD